MKLQPSRFAVVLRTLGPVVLVAWAAGVASAQELVVSTFAGQATSSGATDGMTSQARFNGPNHVAVDTAGNIYVADGNNNTVRKITPTGTVTTFAGLAGQFGTADGTGSAARFHVPYGIGVDSGGNVYVSDANRHTIRKITPAGVVSSSMLKVVTRLRLLAAPVLKSPRKMAGVVAPRV